MSSSRIRVYEQYAWKPEYDGVPCTYGGFAIIVRHINGRWTVLIKRRNDKGLLFDLPGGGMHVGPDGDAIDPDLEAACMREAWEEVWVRCRILAGIGPPLYFPIWKDGVLIKVDCAQPYLVHTVDEPMISKEAIELAWVDQFTFGDYPIANRKVDPNSPVFGRTPLMIADALSIMQRPFWIGRVTDQIRRKVIGDLRGRDFILVDGGAYLAKTFLMNGPRGRKVRYIALYRRWNSDQPNGYFPGCFDHLSK